MATPSQHDDHEARIRYLERVTESLDKHLGQVVQRFDRFEKRLMVVAAVLFASSTNGSKVAEVVSKLFS